MNTLIRRFLRDDSGSVVVGEWVFVATILMLGAVAGAAALHTTSPRRIGRRPRGRRFGA